MVNLNYLRHNMPVQWQSQEAISCLVMIMSIPIANHRTNLMVLNQFSRFSKYIYLYTWVSWQMSEKTMLLDLSCTQPAVL